MWIRMDPDPDPQHCSAASVVDRTFTPDPIRTMSGIHMI
jgi:hypothetical protein